MAHNLNAGDRIEVTNPYPLREKFRGRVGTVRLVFPNEHGDKVDLDAHLDPVDGQEPVEGSDPIVFAMCEVSTVKDGPLQ